MSMPFGEHPLALHAHSCRSALGRVGSAARTACAALFLPQPRMSAPHFHRAFARSSSSLCSTNGASLGSADAHWLRGWRGEEGCYLVERMGLEISPETLLRLVRKQEEQEVPTPRVLGVDDFSFRRRRSYGTILIDLERRVPVDLRALPGSRDVGEV